MQFNKYFYEERKETFSVQHQKHDTFIVNTSLKCFLNNVVWIKKKKKKTLRSDIKLL